MPRNSSFLRSLPVLILRQQLQVEVPKQLRYDNSRFSMCKSVYTVSLHDPFTLLCKLWKYSLNAQTSPWSVAERLYDPKPVTCEWGLLISCGRQPAFWAEVVRAVKVRRKMVGCVLMDADCGPPGDKAAVNRVAPFGDETAQTRWRWWMHPKRFLQHGCQVWKLGHAFGSDFICVCERVSDF